jgi:hypothetical protein
MARTAIPTRSPPGLRQEEDMTNAFRSLWADVLVLYVRLLRR